MSSERLKETIQTALRVFGVELRRAGATVDAFGVQKELVTKAEPVIFDVGAHVGSVALKYRALFPRAAIWCFEPFAPSFHKLQQSLASDRRMSCHNLAVSDAKGRAVLNANLASVTNSLLPSDERGSSYWGEGLLNTTDQVEVSTTTIDDFVVENSIGEIDILKLDVQGAEFKVLTGATNTLRRQQVALLYTEMIMCPTYKGQHEFHDYLKFLGSLGYEMLDLFNAERSGRQLIQADVIFLSSSFKEQLRRSVPGN